MPWVTVKAKAGRTVEQKKGLVEDITAAVVKHFKVDPEQVLIDIIEYSLENVAKGGKLYRDR